MVSDSSNSTATPGSDDIPPVVVVSTPSVVVNPYYRLLQTIMAGEIDPAAWVYESIGQSLHTTWLWRWHERKVQVVQLSTVASFFRQVGKTSAHSQALRAWGGAEFGGRIDSALQLISMKSRDAIPIAETVDTVARSAIDAASRATGKRGYQTIYFGQTKRLIASGL